MEQGVEIQILSYDDSFHLVTEDPAYPLYLLSFCITEMGYGCRLR